MLHPLRLFPPSLLPVPSQAQLTQDPSSPRLGTVRFGHRVELASSPETRSNPERKRQGVRLESPLYEVHGTEVESDVDKGQSGKPRSKAQILAIALSKAGVKRK